MYKVYDFECRICCGVFEAMVEGSDGKPDKCDLCGAEGPFDKLVAAPKIPTTIIPSYPGAKRRKAGYVHTHGDRPAEKAGSQVSMHIPKNKD